MYTFKVIYFCYSDLCSSQDDSCLRFQLNHEQKKQKNCRFKEMLEQKIIIIKCACLIFPT